MKYVSVIRRIIAIDKALARIPEEERYDDVWERLYDKRDTLAKSLKDYIKRPNLANKELRHAWYIRRKQVILACTLLHVDFHKVIR